MLSNSFDLLLQYTLMEERDLKSALGEYKKKKKKMRAKLLVKLYGEQ